MPANPTETPLRKAHGTGILNLVDFRANPPASEAAMVFSSLIFIYAFLPACLLAYNLVRSNRAKNWVLLLFSLFFYAWGEPVWVLLMIFTGFFIWLMGLQIEKNRGRPGSKIFLTLAVIGALASLAIFKYAGFAIENFNGITGLHVPVPGFSLPIGISFYTFQTLTYAIDLYWGKTGVQRSLANFLLYESLFPQLIAGPIVRYADVAEMIESRKVTLDGFLKGISRFMVGLGKKVLIANYAGQLVGQTIGGDVKLLSVAEGWLGILAFAFQIYFDFSGYSDMAIGLGRMFGFEFKENFEYPYIASSITDFWRRWHISLSTFFRDYVYIPLGGNRRFQTRNMFIVWALTGLWHGASWNFVFWGLYFFVLLFIEKKFLLKVFDRLPRFVRHVYTLSVVLLGWVLFYFTDLASVWQMLRLMFGASGQVFLSLQASIFLQNNAVFLLIAGLASTPLAAALARKSQRTLVAAPWQHVLASVETGVSLVILFICTAALVGSSYNPFLYFRF
jgi:alginate O-acetyltransferase complex protein AlgI